MQGGFFHGCRPLVLAILDVQYPIIRPGLLRCCETLGIFFASILPKILIFSLGRPNRSKSEANSTQEANGFRLIANIGAALPKSSGCSPVICNNPRQGGKSRYGHGKEENRVCNNPRQGGKTANEDQMVRKKIPGASPEAALEKVPALGARHPNVAKETRTSPF